jgi:hypothetical protein
MIRYRKNTMHDLNTINRLNAERHAAEINRLRSLGRHVVATYNGLALISLQDFSYEDGNLAEELISRDPESPDEHYALFPAFVPQPDLRA